MKTLLLTIAVLLSFNTHAAQMSCIQSGESTFCNGTDDNGNPVHTNVYRFGNIITTETSGTDSNGESFINRCTITKLGNFTSTNCN